MTATDPTPAATDTAPAEEGQPSPVDVVDPELVEDDLLVEEISIDGMCGVY